MILKIFLALLLGVPFTIINFSAYLKGNPPSTLHLVSTLLFLLLWMLWGFYINFRDKESTSFMKFSSVYCLVSIACVFVMYLIDSILFSIPVGIIILGPVYGLRYFLPSVSYEAFGYICVIVVYAVSLIGSLIGYVSSKNVVK